MNGLSLRISTGAKKKKNIMSLSPAVVTNLPNDIAQNKKVQPFLRAATASEQLAELNQLLKIDADDKTIMKLLVIVYFQSETKHPVKCFLTRHITKNKQLQEPFIDLLSLEISFYLRDKHTSYKAYRDTVSKIGMCLESFPAGTSAVENVGHTLAPYLNRCFECCLDTFRTLSLSPTEKSVVYSLAHLTLRILLHIITKIQPKLDHTELCKALYTNMRESLDVFLMDNDMPMDTKSVCGLVALALDAYKYDDGPNHDAWRNFLYSKENVLMSEEAQLAMFSAIITAVPMKRLQEKHNPDELTPIETIVLKLMDIVEKCSTDGVLILGVARALGRLSRSLPELEVDLGVQVSEQLLGFVWSHLEHYMDSVKHQAAQLLATTVQYCALLEINGSSSVALSSALHRLSELGAGRRGYHAGVRGVARVLPASRLLPAASPARLLPALLQGELTSTVSYTLEDLLTRHSKEVHADVIYEEWLLPILHFARTHDLEPQILTTLENLLDKAVQLNKDLVSFILPLIKQASESPEDDLRNVLVLLSVARRSLTKMNMTSDQDGERWGGVLRYVVLKEAVVDARDEVRVTGLGLVCKGEARTPTLGELVVLRYYLEHCGRESTHVRQLARPMLTKFIRRLYDANRAAIRNRDKEQEIHIIQLIEELRQDCYTGLTRGASLARRATLLDMLLEVEMPCLSRSWKVEYVEKLLIHLDDSYETNKRYAVDLLCRAPVELLEEIESPILRVEDILSSASALRPAECATAAVRLEVVWRRLPHRLLQGKTCTSVQPALYSVLSLLLARVNHTYDALRAPRDSPTYGLLHSIARFLDIMDPETIVGDKEWDHLIIRLIDMCRHVLQGAGSVVDRAAPEGALPPDSRYTDYGNNAGVMLEDGRQVTAQMVLLCAWRTVKEATGILGSLGGRLKLPSLSTAGVCSLAELLARVLSNARHRGAFEQAYVAFERVVARMWRDPDMSVSSWPSCQLAHTLSQLREPSTSARLADRRSAGLPFLIQAIVSTEPGAGGPGTGLRDVMTALLDRAGGEGTAGAGEGEGGANDRAHACNVLRALYRDSSLDSAVQGFVGDGLRVALQGFEGATWTERNSSTLLLSALITRVFGVNRSRVLLESRNRMTGRVFYLRYPHLYDIMLNKLKEANSSEEKLLLCPSLYPVLLLLGRLYPSSLEGTESNLKLVSFVPLVVSLSRSRVLLTRRLAAAAAVPLIPPDRYASHLQYLLGLVSSSRIQMNLCHGVLLQICALLEHKPPGVTCSLLATTMPGTLWILETSCWPVLHQYTLMLVTLHHRFPETLQQATVDTIYSQLRRLLLENKVDPPASGRSLALAACLQLLLQLTRNDEDIADLIVQSLRHNVSEVCETALDYLLTMQDKDGTRRKLRAHAEYLPSLAEPLRRDEFWKKEPLRAYKHLEVLIGEGDTQEMLITAKQPAVELTADDVIHELSRLIDSAPDSVTHLYLDSLTSYISPRVTTLSVHSLHSYCAMLHSCCLPWRPDTARLKAARALHDHGVPVLKRVEEEDLVEIYVWMVAAQLLRDIDDGVQTLAAAAAMLLAGLSGHSSVVPERATVLLLEACVSRARGAGAGAGVAGAVLTTLALCSSLPTTLDTNHDDWRIFEPRDQEIALAEEKQWTCACADKVVDLCTQQGIDPLTHVIQTLDQCLPYLDNDTVDAVKKLAAGDNVQASPLVELFVRKLKGVL